MVVMGRLRAIGPAGGRGRCARIAARLCGLHLSVNRLQVRGQLLRGIGRGQPAAGVVVALCPCANTACTSAASCWNGLDWVGDDAFVCALPPDCGAARLVWDDCGKYGGIQLFVCRLLIDTIAGSQTAALTRGSYPSDPINHQPVVTWFQFGHDTGNQRIRRQFRPAVRPPSVQRFAAADGRVEPRP